MSRRYLFFGYGYCAQTVADVLRAQAIPYMAGYHTRRPADDAVVALNDSKALAQAATDATHWLISAPPDADGCPIARLVQTDCPKATPRWVGYLSTTGVYGNYDGKWVDETTPLRPSHARAQQRVRAEHQWAELTKARAAPLVVMRLAGIYGPRRNALCRLRDGRASAIHKPGQVFSRIHVADIVQAVLAAHKHQEAGLYVYNICDDKPCPPFEPLAFAAKLMGIAAPTVRSWNDAKQSLSPMAQEFYMDNKRVRNKRLKQDLGVKLRYPSYKEGLTALWKSGEGR